MAMFKAFKPAAMNKIAQAMGYQGDMGQFQQYIEQDPARQQQMNMYTNAAKQMAKGGSVQKFAPGGIVLQQPSVAPMNAPAGQYSLTGQPAPTTTTTAAAPTQTAPTVQTTGVTGQQGTPIATVPTPSGQGPGVTDFSVQQMYSPGVPVGGETVAAGIGYEPSQDEKVHAMTLKVTMEDWKEKGNEVPEDLFWTFDGNQTKIKNKS